LKGKIIMYEQSSNDFATGYAVGRDSANGGYGNGMFGGDWSWWIIILLIFGWGGNGYGFGGFGGGFGAGAGALATQADLAAGFNNSAVINKLNDLTLGQAGIQQTLCQGFNGVNTTVLQGFNGVDNAVCTLGYNMQAGFNGLAHQISDCCCQTQRAIDGVNYNMAKSTCDIIQAGNANTQRLLDYFTGEKIAALTAQNAALTAQLSQNSQTATLLNAINRTPVPAYVVANPYCCNTYQGCGCGA
jgi:hypothetical protein